MFSFWISSFIIWSFLHALRVTCQQCIVTVVRSFANDTRLLCIALCRSFSFKEKLLTLSFHLVDPAYTVIPNESDRFAVELQLDGIDQFNDRDTCIYTR